MRAGAGALEIVVDNLEQSLIAVVDEHRDGWVAEVDAELAADFETYGDAIEEVASARARMSQRFALRRWLCGFPETIAVYAEGGSRRRRAQGDVRRPVHVHAGDRRAATGRTDRPHEVAPVRDSLGAETQRIHEERMRNEQAGLGYYTDAELQRRNQNPFEFDHGQDAKLVGRVRVPSDSND